MREHKRTKTLAYKIRRVYVMQPIKIVFSKRSDLRCSLFIFYMNVIISFDS